MDVEQLYDEFGNYIGPEQSDSDSDSLQLPDLPSENQQPAGDTTVNDDFIAETSTDQADGRLSQAIVLAEDKKLYPSADEVFGPDTQVLVEEEDAQLLAEPLVAPVVEPSSGLHEKDHTVPPSNYNRAYLTTAIAPHPSLIRNVALVGNLHHGKTSIVDMMFDATHTMPWSKLDDREFPVRYMDTRFDEQRLNLSMKTTAATFLLQTNREKSYAVTILDTPGHPNFLDETIAAMTLVDAIVVVVDVAEGVMMSTELILRRAATMRLHIVLIISKLDRLCLELRLPPKDAYHKIRQIVDACNDVISPFQLPELSPAVGNVAFASSNERVCFTLPQFARTYIHANGGEAKFPLSPEQLARCFWGNIYYDAESRKFTKDSRLVQAKRTFVSFVLEPFYKLHTAVLSEDVADLTKFLERNQMLAEGRRKGSAVRNGFVRKKALNTDLKAMLKEVGSSCFGMGSLTGLAEMLVEHVVAPVETAARAVQTLGKVDWPRSDDFSDLQQEWKCAMDECDTDPSVPMAAYIAKLVPDERGSRFDCLLRVLSGRLRVNETVSVLGQSYDELTSREDFAPGTIKGIYMPCGRFKIELKEAVAGQIVLVRGIDQTINKSATIVSTKLTANHDALAFQNIRDFLPPAVVKVAVEPVRPAELPKMVSSLRQCSNSYPGLVTKVEETGEHTLIGSGELYLDCVLRDLREAYGKVEVKVSDPVVPFAETVSETSALQCYADTPNKQNKMVMAAEPLEETILNALEEGKFESSDNLRAKLREHGWDALAAKSLWTFGPDPSKGPNALVNDVLIEDSRFKADIVRDSIVQGFCWAVREGPLADEPVRGVKMRLLDTRIAENETARSAAQMIPTARRVVFSSILTAGPRLMEPINVVEIICAPEAMKVANTLVSRRRGIVLSEEEVVGTPLKRMIVHMPVIDSFGFEPDLRGLTHGSAFCLQMFDHWAVMPGDPLDRSVELRPLEAARRHELARECMVKTRRRKGLGDKVGITKYLNDPLLVELASENEELRRLL